MSHTPAPAVCYPKATKVTKYQKYTLQHSHECLIKLLRTAILMFRINVSVMRGYPRISFIIQLQSTQELKQIKRNTNVKQNTV